MLRLRDPFRVALALMGSLALAVVITWPLALEMRTSLAGHPGNDTWNHIWGYWWVHREVMANGAVPFRTELLNHPTGGTLFFIDTFNALQALALRPLLGLVGSFNGVVLLALTWNTFGAWALGRHVLRDDVLAMVPAAVFGTCAHLLGQAYNGITESLNVGWLPLYTLALLMTLERPRLRRGLLMGLTLALCSLTNFYYGLFGILLSVLVVVHHALTAARRVRWGSFVLATLAGAALYAALVLPVLGELSTSMAAADAVVARDPRFVWVSLLNHNITDLVSFFRPGHHYSPDLKALYGEDLIIVIYLGWAALLLAGAAAALHRPRQELGLWLWLAGAFFVFSLGPYLHVNGEYVLLSGRKVPLPFLPFFEAFPLFSRISHPFRFVVPVSLAVGVLAGFGVRELARRTRLPVSALAPAAAALVVAEILLASPVPWPLPRSEASVPTIAATLPAEGAVLDLPITMPNLERAVYLWYQANHGRPGPWGLNDPLPDPLEENPLTWVLVNIEASRALSLPRTLPDLELVMGAELLRAQGYRAIVVHEALYPQAKRDMVNAVLTGLFGPPRRVEGEPVALYDLSR